MLIFQSWLCFKQKFPGSTIFINFSLLNFKVSYCREKVISLGLEVMAEDSNWEVLGSNPHYADHFSGTVHLDQSLEQKLWKTLTWHCYKCCNPANGRVDFEEWSAYKIQLHGIEWIVSLSADWDQSPKKTIVGISTVKQIVKNEKFT